MFDNFLHKYLTSRNIIFCIISILFLIFLTKISEVAILFFASFVIACSLDPVVEKLSKKFKRSTACVITVLGAILLVIAFFIPIIIIGGNEIISFADSFPAYIENIKNIVLAPDFVLHGLITRLDIGDMISSASVFSSKLITDILNVGINLGAAIIYLIASILIIYYFLVDRDIVRATILKLFPKQMRLRAGKIVQTIAERSGGYIVAQLVTMSSVGIVVTIGLLFLKSEYALLLGLISAVLDIIPVIGPAIAFIICMIAVFKSGPVILFFTAVIFIVAQLVENNFVRPYVFGKFLNLHPLLIYMFIFIAAKYIGVIGVVFAPAIAATVAVLIEELYMKSLE